MTLATLHDDELEGTAGSVHFIPCARKREAVHVNSRRYIFLHYLSTLRKDPALRHKYR